MNAGILAVADSDDGVMAGCENPAELREDHSEIVEIETYHLWDMGIPKVGPSPAQCIERGLKSLGGGYGLRCPPFRLYMRAQGLVTQHAIVRSGL